MICRHFGKCGGCSFQDIPYEEQLANKREELISIAGDENIVDMIPSPEIFGFRNKMEYSFDGESLGLHERGRFDVVIDLKECPVFSDWIGGFLDDVRGFARDNAIPFYTRKENSGVLRYLIVRESKYTGEKLIVLVVDGNRFKHDDEFMKMVTESIGPAVVVIARRHETGDSALTEDYYFLSDSKKLGMRIGNKEFLVSPFAFFQPNSYQVKNMYDIVLNNTEADSKVLDLYSGAGTIPFYIYRDGMNIAGVEFYKGSVEDAELVKKETYPDADINFIQATVRTYIANVTESYDYIVLDPPRGGISYRVWKHINKLSGHTGSIKKIFFICCSLKNLKSDLEYIKENFNWKIDRITGVDQFVHTPHLETVVEFVPEYT